MAAPKGTMPPNAGKGRKLGSKNKLPSDVRAMIVGALEAVGGMTYLQKQAETNPESFLSLVGKTLPKEIKAEISERLCVMLNGKGIGPGG